MAAPVLPRIAAAAAAPAIAFTARWFLSSSTSAGPWGFCWAETRIAARELRAARRTRRPA